MSTDRIFVRQVSKEAEKEALDPQVVDVVVT